MSQTTFEISHVDGICTAVCRLFSLLLALYSIFALFWASFWYDCPICIMLWMQYGSTCYWIYIYIYMHSSLKMMNLKSRDN